MAQDKYCPACGKELTRADDITELTQQIESFKQEIVKMYRRLDDAVKKTEVTKLREIEDKLALWRKSSETLHRRVKTVEAKVKLHGERRR